MNKTFTQKHYEKLASFFRYELEIALEVQGATKPLCTAQSIEASTRVNTIRGLIRLLANNLENDNPKFNRSRFFKACGLGE